MQPLSELLHDLEQEMLRLGYAEGSVKSYRRRWQRPLQFSKERGEVFYSEHLGGVLRNVRPGATMGCYIT